MSLVADYGSSDSEDVKIERDSRSSSNEDDENMDEEDDAEDDQQKYVAYLLTLPLF